MNNLSFNEVVKLQTQQATIFSLSETTAVYRQTHSKRMDRLEVQSFLSEQLSREFHSYTPNVVVVKELWGDNRTNYCVFFRIQSDRVHSFHASLLKQDRYFTTMTIQHTTDGETKKLLASQMIHEEWMKELKHSFLEHLIELPLYRLHAVTGGLIV